MPELDDDIQAELKNLLAEIADMDRHRVKGYVKAGEHEKVVAGRDEELVRAVTSTVEVMTQAIVEALSKPRQIERDPETNRIVGSRHPAPVMVAPPAVDEAASPAVKALYASLLRLGYAVSSVVNRPKRVGQDENGRPFIIQ